MAARINRRVPQRLELIPDLKRRGAAFSKRRAGLYKRAYELSILCGIDIALVMFSPTDKPYSFGCPNVNCLMDRYLVEPPYPMNHPQNIMANHCNPSLLVLNERLNMLQKQSHAEKQRGKELDQMEKSCQEQNWMEGPIDQMTEPERHRFMDALLALKEEVQRLKIQSEGSSSSGLARGFAGGSSSNLGTQVQHPPPAGAFQPPVLHNPVAHQNAIVMVPTPRGHNKKGGGHERWHF